MELASTEYMQASRGFSDLILKLLRSAFISQVHQKCIDMHGNAFKNDQKCMKIMKESETKSFQGVRGSTRMAVPAFGPRSRPTLEVWSWKLQPLS